MERLVGRGILFPSAYNDALHIFIAGMRRVTVYRRMLFANLVIAFDNTESEIILRMVALGAKMYRADTYDGYYK